MFTIKARVYKFACIVALGILTFASCPSQAADETVSVFVTNPITLNPNTPNPVTIVNPPNAPSTVSLNPNTPNPVTIESAPKVNSYQDFGQSSCAGPGSCELFFSAVTVETLIRHASCSFILPTGASVFNAFLISGPITGPFNAVQPFTTGVSTAGLTSWGLNVDTYLFVAKGNAPLITISPSGGSIEELQCTVSGTKNG